MIEHIAYPFVGTQFHLERNIFDFSDNPLAIKFADYFAQKIVELARNN